MLLLIDSGINTGNITLEVAGKNFYKYIKSDSGNNTGNFAGKTAGKKNKERIRL